MYNAGSISYTNWECKYHIVWCHIVWIPKYRKSMGDNRDTSLISHKD